MRLDLNVEGDALTPWNHSHPAVKVVGAPERHPLNVLRLMLDGAQRDWKLQERQLHFQDLRLADGRVVLGTWDAVESTLHVWRPHLMLYGVEVLRELAVELAFGIPADEVPVEKLEPQRILLVEDDEMVARAVQRVLEQAGFVVITTASPFAFRSLFNKEKPVLVLVDLKLPAITGDALIQLVKLGGGRHHCPMVLFSAETDEELERLVQKSGAAGYIRKTGSLVELAEQARGFITTAQQRTP